MEKTQFRNSRTLFQNSGTQLRNPKIYFGLLKFVAPVILVLVAGIVGVCYLTVQASNNLRQPVQERPINDIDPNIEQKQRQNGRLKSFMNEKNPDFLIDRTVYNETDLNDISTDSNVRMEFFWEILGKSCHCFNFQEFETTTQTILFNRTITKPIGQLPQIQLTVASIIFRFRVASIFVASIFARDKNI